MRATYFLFIVAFFPELSVAATQCILPEPAARLTMADTGPASPGPAEAAPATAPMADKLSLPPITPEELARAPALKHVADTGAVLGDLGAAHGVHTVFARQGEHFMVLQIAPDGAAVVAGLQSDLSVAQVLAVTGSEAKELGTAHGLRGLLVSNGQQFQVLYGTPDGERVIPGVMWDVDGKNITREQVAPIAGAIPTVVLAQRAGGSGAPATPPVSLLSTLKDASFGAAGDDRAPRVWMFVDPLCGPSRKALQTLQPYVADGRIQLAVVPLSILDSEDQGRSTKDAMALLSKPPADMIGAWSKGDFTSGDDPTAGAKLQTNMVIAAQIGLLGTPTLIWRKADGTEGRQEGADDVGAILTSIGGKNGRPGW